MDKKQTVNSFWVGKKAHIEIYKDNKRLYFTATIMEMDKISVTFIDRESIVYSFNRMCIKEMSLVM